MHKLSKIKNQIIQINEALKKIPTEDLIIVEGLSDVEALRSLDIDNKIIPLDKQPLYKIIDSATKLNLPTHILMDFDTEGKKLYKTLYTELTKKGIKINNEFRLFLKRHTPIKQIEDLNNYYNNMLEDLESTF